MTSKWNKNNTKTTDSPKEENWEEIKFWMIELITQYCFISFIMLYTNMFHNISSLESTLISQYDLKKVNNINNNNNSRILAPMCSIMKEKSKIPKMCSNNWWHIECFYNINRNENSNKQTNKNKQHKTKKGDKLIARSKVNKDSEIC